MYDFMTDADHWFYTVNAYGDLEPRFTRADCQRLVDNEVPASSPDVRARLARDLYRRARQECDGLERVWLRMR